MAREPRLIGEAASLEEGGKAIRFDWPQSGGAGTGFVIRYEGNARAYVNRCPHLGVELDWQPGEFFEESGLYLICSTHGAIFEPSGGLCVAGPCKGARLQAIEIEERAGSLLLIEDCAEAPAPKSP